MCSSAGTGDSLSSLCKWMGCSGASSQSLSKRESTVSSLHLLRGISRKIHLLRWLVVLGKDFVFNPNMMTTFSASQCACMLSHAQLFETVWIVAHQTPLSMGFSRQESWSGLPYPPPGDLPDPRTEPMSLVSSALSRQILYQLNHLGSNLVHLAIRKT